MAVYRGTGGSISGVTEADTILIPVSQGGTGATTIVEARLNLNAAKSGVNVDITQLQGLEVPLSVDQGGTGARTAGAALANLGAATAAQGALAESALQTADVATVAITGSYNDLSDKPTAGTGDVVGPTSATNGAVALFDGTTGRLLKNGVVLGSAATTSSTDYATAAQGTKADTAVQTETDPVFTAHAAYNVTNTKITNWDTAYTDRNNWDGGSTGLVAATGRTSLGLGTSATTAATDYATAAQGTKADTAYGWGNHASAGYLTSATASTTYAPLTGTGASGTWGISISGNAATATNVAYSGLTGTVPTWNQNTTGSAATLTTGRTIGMTGDLTWTSGSFNGSANVTGTGTLATVNANVGSFGSSSAVPVITVNAKGLVTAVSTSSVSGGQYFGSAATKAIAYNSQTIAENVTVTSGNSGLSAGPITISSGFAVTVASGSRWVIV